MRKKPFSPVALLGALAMAFLLVNACGGEQVVEMPDTGSLAMDGGATGRILTVTSQASRTPLALGRATPVLIGGFACARLSEVVALALPGRPPGSLVATDFLSSEGFSPRSKSNCDGLLPVSSGTLARGYIDLATGNLRWDEALGYPGCMVVTDTAEMQLADQ